jgi:hypothetical protein
MKELLRTKLLTDARERCCLHRRVWLRVVPTNQLAVKWERLDIHHVQFRSCGGSDLESNLVPLCPGCHTTLHTARLNGDDFVSDQDLLDTWKHWKFFSTVVPKTLSIGSGTPAQFGSAKLDIYGLKVEIEVDATTLYTDFRRQVLSSILDPLRLSDSYFPFLSGISGSRWILSSDEATTLRWNEVSAATVLAQHSDEIRFGCPAVVLMTRDVHWLSSFEEHHRWL